MAFCELISHFISHFKIKSFKRLCWLALWIPVSFHLEDVRRRVSVQSHWGRLNLEIILWWGVMAVKIYDQTSACVGVLPPDGSRRQRTPMSCWTNSWGLYHPQQLPCWDCSDTDFPKSTHYLQSIKHIWWANKYNIAISCLNLFWGPI